MFSRMKPTFTNLNATKLNRVLAMTLRIMTGAMLNTAHTPLDHITNTMHPLYHQLLQW